MRDSTDAQRTRDLQGRRAGGATSVRSREAGRPGGRGRSAVDPQALIDGQPGVLAALARSWPLAVVLVLAGLTTGAAWAWRTPDVHTAETRLSIGSQELSAQAVPGYAYALQTMTANYARYVQTTDSVREELVTSMGAPASTIVEVTASPIPESNVLRIEVAGTDPQVAVKAADQVGASLVGAVAEDSSGIDAQREELTAASQAVAAAEQQEQAAQLALDELLRDARADQVTVDAARQALVDASTAAAVLTVEQEALSNAYRTAFEDSGRATTLSVIRPAEVVMDDGATSLQRWGAIGTIAGASAAVLMAVLLDRGHRRRDRRSVALVEAHDDDVAVRPPSSRIASWR